MVEPTQKEMLHTLIGKVDHVIEKQDDIKTKQDNMELVVNDIKIELVGTKMDPERGMVSRLKKAENCLIEIKKKQYKITTVGVVVITAANIALMVVRTLIKGG